MIDGTAIRERMRVALALSWVIQPFSKADAGPKRCSAQSMSALVIGEFRKIFGFSRPFLCH